MNVYEIDPTTDERWEDFLHDHPQASIFHTRGWLEALRRTYGYSPLALTTSTPNSPLTNGIPLCKITGWFGRRRLVALPFSDHCVPLVESTEQLTCLLGYLREKVEGERWSFVQIRANEAVVASPWDRDHRDTLVLHELDLRPTVDDIFQGFHPSCVQRKIRRAGRENLAYQEGRSEALLKAFYSLLLKTRRRHGVPPQPFEWFLNLIAYLGEAVKIRVAFNRGLPIAGIVTLCYKRTMMYKYGCSSSRFTALGGMQFLLWNAIQEAKTKNIPIFDMGRSEVENQGLVLFKDRWGATRSTLRYFQYPPQRVDNKFQSLQLRVIKGLCSRAPTGLLAAAGKVLYKYAG
jgi:Acetyltransferase (GNAT) domain